MKTNTLCKIILAALVVLNIADGDFRDPSVLDWIKFAVIGAGLIVLIVKDWRQRHES